jgi:hypothetical protein
MGGVEVWRMDGVKGVQLPNFRSPQPAVLVSPHHLNAETFGTTLPRKEFHKRRFAGNNTRSPAQLQKPDVLLLS